MLVECGRPPVARQHLRRLWCPDDAPAAAPYSLDRRFGRSPVYLGWSGRSESGICPRLSCMEEAAAVVGRPGYEQPAHTAPSPPTPAGGAVAVATSCLHWGGGCLSVMSDCFPILDPQWSLL